jgi:hypothetical protein
MCSSSVKSSIKVFKGGSTETFKQLHCITLRNPQPKQTVDMLIKTDQRIIISIVAVQFEIEQHVVQAGLRYQEV